MQCRSHELHEYLWSPVCTGEGVGFLEQITHSTQGLYCLDVQWGYAEEGGLKPGPLTILLFGQSSLCGEHGCREGTGKGPGGWHWLEKARPNTAHPEARPCGARGERLQRTSGR